METGKPTGWIVSVSGCRSISGFLSILAKEAPLDDIENMNAAEIIDEIKLLPADEQVKVIEYVKRIPNPETIEAMNEPTDQLKRFETVEALFDDLDS